MKIVIRNNTDIANKYVRFIKWKLYRIRRKFKSLIYAIVHIKRVTKKKDLFKVTITLGVPGRDIVISHKKTSLSRLFRDSVDDVHRYLNEHKKMRLSGQFASNK